MTQNKVNAGMTGDRASSNSGGRTYGELVERVESLIATLGVGAAPNVTAEVMDWARRSATARYGVTTVNGVCRHCSSYPCVGRNEARF